MSIRIHINSVYLIIIQNAKSISVFASHRNVVFFTLSPELDEDWSGMTPEKLHQEWYL